GGRARALRKLVLGDAEGFVDGVAQIGRLKFALQVVGLVGDDEVLAARDAQLDAHHRRDRAAAGLGALVDPDAATDKPIVDLLELLDPLANFLLRPRQARHVVEGDLDGDLLGHAPRCWVCDKNARAIIRVRRPLSRYAVTASA